MRFSQQRLEDWATALFIQLDVLPDHASVTAKRLVEADLRGRTGHGIIRVPQYVDRIRAGGINLRPKIRLDRDSPVSALVDGDNALGQVVMTTATEAAIDKALTTGMAWVGTTRSNHAGAAGVYTGMALNRRLIAVYFAVASANVMPPWGGDQRVLGTNPVAIAVPAGVENDFQLDIATTVASHGTIKVVAQAGESMPEGWVIDPAGAPITDPNRADEGFLMPIGGYKGSGLNIAIGLLAGVLNDAAFGNDVIDHRNVSDKKANTGQAIFVMRPDLMRDTDNFLGDMDRQIRDLRAAGESVHLPGDGVVEQENQVRRLGIPIADSLLGQLQSLSDAFVLTDRLESE